MESAGISNRGEILSSSAVMRASWEAGDEAEADDGAVKAVVLEKCRRAIPSPLLILPFQLLLLTDGDSLKHEEMRLGIIDGTCLGSWKRRDCVNVHVSVFISVRARLRLPALTSRLVLKLIYYENKFRLSSGV
jgi:hypothetical protein